MSRYKRPSRPAPAEIDCFTIEEFTTRHRISKQFYYKLRAAGRGPEEIRIGSKVLITKEAAQAWRERESALP